MKDVLLFMIVLAAGLTNALGQVPFSCPVPNAAAACNSYRELIANNDRDFSFWRTHVDVGLVCFRDRPDDAFFAILWQWPRYLGSTAPVGRREDEGLVSIHYYRDGVWDHDLELLGTWKEMPDIDGYVGNRFTSNSRYSSRESIVVSSTNLEASDPSSGYDLNLQISAKRFVERWIAVDGSRVDMRGRCISFVQGR